MGNYLHWKHMLSDVGARWQVLKRDYQFIFLFYRVFLHSELNVGEFEIPFKL